MISRQSIWLPLFALLLVSPWFSGNDAVAQQTAVGEPGYLGIIADDQRTNGTGVRLLKVLPEGPAEKGGLEVADLITAVNQKQVRNMQDMAEAIMGSQAGDELLFEVIRSEEPETVRVELGRRPPPNERRFPQFGEIPAEAPADSETVDRGSQLWLGVRAVDASTEDQTRLGRPGLRGAAVTEVVENSPASEAGLEKGAVIVTLDDQRITGSRLLIDTVRAASPNTKHTMAYYDPSGSLVQTDVALRFRGTPPVADSIPGDLPLPDDGPTEPDSFDLPSPQGNTPTRDATDSLEQRVGRLEAQLSRIEQLLMKLVPPETPEPAEEKPRDPPKVP